MTWHEHAIFWHVYPLGFVGAEPVLDDGAPVQHRLGRLVDWLDYAVDLGVSGLLLGPVFTARSHGYDTIDHLTVDPRLGDRSDFETLVAAAHARGLKVVLDGVFNHVGRDHPLFRAAVTGGPAAPEAELFHLSWPAGGAVNPAPGAPAEPEYRTFEGHAGLVALNHDAPAVVALVTEVMNHWLDAGADGWRLDAAYAVPPAFWAQVLPEVRARHPEVYVVGEVIHGDYAAVVADSGMDSVTQYELWKAIWSALNDHNLYELAHALGRHDAMVEAFAPQTFVGNHDVTRIATRLTDRRHLPHALVVLLTVAGTPAVYYGDEQAMTGLKEERLGGDDAIRPAYPAAPADLPAEGWATYHLHQELIGLRRRHPWLHRSRLRVLHLANELLAYEQSAGAERVVVVLNLADDAAQVPAAGAGRVLAGSAEVLADGVRVPGHGWAVLGG
ncbi:alpha-amylase family glycosyl hydrolase [Georgenia sp. TF02-10]|uniref:alpha-amylase family glycosyl hydrolase n=1 Tax=Georgenia sp. TF02-10 TaxID=2917725 RepID=UPI001FA767A7|nr:alpha-amylase family glycosyl hydrolase [Georgenia sp. TF02-10]UNX53780.1 alpha-amylase family glycosyl hydrolase [Georgenia sp. TF02-10]